MEFRLIPAGTFIMGSRREGEGPLNAQMRRARPDFDSNDPRGGANIDFQRYIRSLNPEFNGDQQPVVFVPWLEVVAYAEWLSETRYSWGDDDTVAHLYANLNDPVTAEFFRLDGPFPNDDGYRAAAPVGSFRANAYGQFDMHGNVSEWTSDPWQEDFFGPPEKGIMQLNRSEPRQRVVKGGSFEASPAGQGFIQASSGGRNWNYTDNRNFSTGFRLVIEIPE